MRRTITAVLGLLVLACSSQTDSRNAAEEFLFELERLSFLAEEKGDYYIVKRDENGKELRQPDGVTPILDQVSLFHPALLVGSYEVTNQEFERFLASTGHQGKGPGFLFHWKGQRVSPPGIEHHPVVFVSFWDAQAYAQWKGGRLPTVAEWERFACAIPDIRLRARGLASGTKYPWGNDWRNQYANTLDLRFDRTTAVGTFEHGKAYSGVYDASGNVWEWAQQEMSGEEYVGKGGSFDYGREKARCEDQRVLDAEQRAQDIGFRCVFELDPYLERRLPHLVLDRAQKERIQNLVKRWGSEAAEHVLKLKGKPGIDASWIQELATQTEEK